MRTCGALGRMAVGLSLAAITTPFSSLVGKQGWGRWRSIVRRLSDVDAFTNKSV